MLSSDSSHVTPGAIWLLHSAPSSPDQSGRGCTKRWKLFPRQWGGVSFKNMHACFQFTCGFFLFFLFLRAIIPQLRLEQVLWSEARQWHFAADIKVHGSINPGAPGLWGGKGESKLRAKGQTRGSHQPKKGPASWPGSLGVPGALSPLIRENGISAGRRSADGLPEM